MPTNHLWPNAALWAVVTRSGALWCAPFSDELHALAKLGEIQRDPTKAENHPFRVVTFVPVEGTIPLESAMPESVDQWVDIIARTLVVEQDNDCGMITTGVTVDSAKKLAQIIVEAMKGNSAADARCSD